ncbi:hypothetical protein DFP74_5733 [Nocardiopsis sp. Huas11]|uniref:hypothetical protein n=1 Tax=Nocardiopsis sp. Huas11 TaxID=2183912 RepID=UPI000EB29EB2|nr:hypothetical protein [Nocardiopsis sp. Huas11]RKS09987.1 hypothetical protein DFP74_5733 [Nocardiopsis sp. Huas11]
MSWLHRSCTEQIRALEGELREAQRREVDHTLAAAALRSERDRAQSERWDAAGEAELLKEKLDTAADRETNLRTEIYDLQYRVAELEQVADEHRQVLEARRRRAAEHALGGAWCGPSHNSSHGRALVAQALMALPLEAYDVKVTYFYDDVYDEWIWQLDGKPVNTDSGFSYTSAVDVLIGRYGFTHQELDSICEQAKRAQRARRAPA